MFKSIQKWLKKKPFGKQWHKYQKKGIVFFMYGALQSRSLVPANAGRGGIFNGVKEKYGIKRLFRLYNNSRITFEKIKQFYRDRFLQYASKSKHRKLLIAIDWTTLYEDYMILSISLITKKGRSIPIAFDGYKKGELKAGKSQSTIEEQLLKLIITALPEKSRKRITVVADRGFDRPQLARFLYNLKVKFVIRVCAGKHFKYKGKEKIISKKLIKQGESIEFGEIEYTNSLPVDVRFLACWEKKCKHLGSSFLILMMKKRIKFYENIIQGGKLNPCLNHKKMDKLA